MFYGYSSHYSFFQYVKKRYGFVVTDYKSLYSVPTDLQSVGTEYLPIRLN